MVSEMNFGSAETLKNVKLCQKITDIWVQYNTLALLLPEKGLCSIFVGSVYDEIFKKQ
jgi:hypothetical protein